MAHPLRWLRRLFSCHAQNGPGRAARPRSWDRYLLQLERLEDRLAPATIITVLNSANGTGSLDALLAFQAGTINATDGGGGGSQPETISAGALAALPATDNISITAQDTIVFNDLGGTLTLATSATRSAGFFTNNGAISFTNLSNTLATSGGALAFDAVTDLTLANLNTAGGSVDLFADFGALSAQNISTGAAGQGAQINAQAQGNVVVGTLSADTLGLTSNNSAVSTRAGGLLQGGALSLFATTGINVHTSVHDVTANNQGSGDISITQVAAPAKPLNIDMGGISNGANATLASSGGAITVVNLGSSIALVADVFNPDLIPGGPVHSKDGTIELLATDLAINNTINSGTARTILGNSVAGTPIDLGTDTAGSIGLTQTELNQVIAGVLQIGTATAGAIKVSQAIAAPTGWNTLHLISGGVISQVATAPLSVTNLAVEGAAGVDLLIDATINSPGNSVATLAGNATNAGAGFTLISQLGLTIGTVDGVAGITSQGNIYVGTQNGTKLLTVDNAVRNSGSLGTSILLFGDYMSLNAPINGGAGRVELLHLVHTWATTLGTTVANSLSLLQSDLNEITAGVLQIGSLQPGSGGGVTVTAPITAPAGWNTLALDDTGTSSISEAGGSLAVTNLAVISDSGIALGSASNSVRNLAFNNNSTGSVSFVDSGSLTIAVVDGVFASSNNGTTTDLTAASPIAFAVTTTSAGTLTATTHNALPLLDGSITVDGGVLVESTGGNVNFNAAADIDIQATSAVKADTGVVSLIAGADGDDPTATLTVDGAIVAVNISLSAPATINLGGTLTAAGTVSITSINGAIVDTNLSNELIAAANLALSAAAGIGSTAAPIETAVANLVARTSTVGIFIDNTGDLTIGFNGDPFQGVFDAGTGDIVLTNAGSVNITSNSVGESVENAGGNITIKAVGTVSDITTGADQLVEIIHFIPFTVTLDAGRNLVLGAAGASGDVIGGGSVVLSAEGAIIVDEGTQVRGDPFGASGVGTVQATAGGNISLLATTNPGARFETSGGSITLTTGAGGIFTNNSGTNGGVLSILGGGNGNITINADDMFIHDPINAGIANVLLQTVTVGRAIDLGTAVQPPTSGPAGPTLGLSNAELQQITAGVLQIGKATAGNIDVTQAISVPNVATLHLISAGTINQAVAGTISVTNLALEGAAGVNVTPNYAIGNNVTTLAGDTTAPLSSFFFINNASMTVGTVDGVIGISAPEQVYVGVQGLDNRLTVSSPVAATNILLFGDTMALNASVNATGTVVLTPPVHTWAITLGTTVANTLSLLQSDLNEVTAAVLQIGSSTASGGINITAPIAATAGWNTLDLEQSGSPSPITEAAGASLTVTNLSVQSFNGGNTILTGNNAVTGQLAADIDGAGKLSFVNTSSLTIGTVNGVVGITTRGGLIGVVLNGLNKLLTIAQPIDSTDFAPVGANVTLTADNMAIAAVVNAGTSVVTLAPFTAGQLLNLGGNDANGTLGLTSAELNQVTAGVVRVGSASAGNISVSGNITAPTTWNTLSLLTAGGVAGNGAATLDIPSLGITAGTGIGTLATPIMTAVGTFAAKAGIGGVHVSNVSPTLTIGSVDGVIGVGATGAGTVDIETVGNLTLNDNVTTGAAPITLAAHGVGNLFTSAAVVSNTGGNTITIIGDSVALTSSSTSAAGGGRIIVQPDTPNRAINLGTSTDTVFELSNNELNTLQTTGVAQIGGPTAGALSILGAIAPANVGTLDLETAGQLTQGAGDTIGLASGANLAIRAHLGASLLENNAVTGQIAAIVSGGGLPFTFANLGSLTVGTADGLNGITTFGGAIKLSLNGANNLLTLAKPLDTTDAGSAPAGANVTLTADNMAINSGVNAGSAIVALAPHTSGQLINLGGNDAVGALGLTSAELSQITAGVVRIGSASAGNISLSNNIMAPATWSTLSLITAGSVAESGLATLNVAALDVTAGTGIGTLAAPLLTTLGSFAAQVGAGGVFVSNFSPTLTIGSVDGVTGIGVTGAGTVDIETIGNLTLNDNMTTGAAPITLAAHGVGNLFTSAAVVSNTGGNTITIVGDRVALNSSSTSAAGGGRIIVQPDTPNQAIHLGTSTDAVFELSSSELNTLQTTGVAQLGGPTAGALIILGAIAPAHVGTLDLETDNQVTQGAGDTITLAGGANLAFHVRAAGIISGVNLPENNIVTGQIAAIVTGLGFPFNFTNLGNLTVGTADGLKGITTFGGAIGLSLTGANNLLTIAQPLKTPPGAAITLTADNMAINAAVGAVTATVTLMPFTVGQLINLGGSDAIGTLGLSNAELNNITAGVLQVGAAAAGNVTVSSNIALNPANVPLMSVLTAGNITGSATVQVSNLSLSSGTGVNLSGVNSIGTLTGAVGTAGQTFVFNNAGNLAIGSVNGVSGIATSGGAITLATAAGDLSILNNVAAGAAPVTLTAGSTLLSTDHLLTNSAAITGNGVTLAADRMALQGGSINVGPGVVILTPITAGRTLDLGGTGEPAGTLQLAAAELSTITASLLDVGSATAGTVTVTAAIAPTSPVLHLITGAGMAEAAGATITAANLALTAPGGVNFGQPNRVNTLAGSTANSPFTFSAAGTFTIGTVDGVVNINAGTSSVSLNSSGAVLGAGALVPDVVGGALVISGATGVGTPATALKTTVPTLTASGGSGGINVANTGDLAIVGGSPNGLAATGGDISISTTGTLTDASDTVNATGNVTFLAGPSINVSGIVSAIGGTVTFHGDAFDKATPTVTFDGTKVSAKQALVEGSSFGGVFNFGPSTSTPIELDGDTGLSFASKFFDMFNLNLNGGLQSSKLSYNFSLTYAPSGFAGSYMNLVDAGGHAFQNISIKNVELPAPTGGFQFDPSSGTVGVAAASFAFTQWVDTITQLPAVTLQADGNTEIFPSAVVPHIFASGLDATASATLTTNDSFLDATNQMQTASEYAVLGNRSGTLYRNAPSGTTEVIGFSGFHSLTAYLTHTDAGTIVGTHAGASAPDLYNSFVSNGATSYMDSGTPAQFAANATAYCQISGASYVYGYSVAGQADLASHYDDGAAHSTMLVSGTAYSYMSGTDKGQLFFNEAVGFTHTYGYATAGNDTAYFLDSLLNDVFVGYTAYSVMYHFNADNSVPEYDYAQGFDLVFASSFVGGDDTALIYQGANVTETGFHLLG